jgi:hypothetical protein
MHLIPGWKKLRLQRMGHHILFDILGRLGNGHEQRSMGIPMITDKIFPAHIGCPADQKCEFQHISCIFRKANCIP